ncbi:hypothetical protein GUITHDRAFT_111751 [Guillardia theta CCMP2712]|uniref:Uncharacterized protein n=1 Tax=Guillardia theta (strain CCMP2712) TaxID=905079 RepID=L1J265_GUITC|nr:hypothetical protein GUITHDRAFT_111751 [Guillardia theta CCMP2712]EKX42185.1 hypothetical protein GUITHDRAFT_111751 [Guillardia theta CCMP2712]|eukprot:XP_005829165.1 hypothetical protein GUITHDRAFT_111751 [Guillardia theta CCMP2712]
MVANRGTFMFLGDSSSNLRAVRIAVLFSCMAAALVLVTLGGRDPVFLENGIDEDMKTAVDKIMARPTEEDNSAKTVATHEARAVKGDLMMERDLIKHMKMVRAQLVNGEPMGTKDIESQIKFLKEDIDFLLLNPESAGYTKIPYDSRKRRLELAQRIKSLVDYLQYRLVTEHGCSIHAVLNDGRCMPDPLPNKLQGDWEQEMYGNSYRAYQPYYYAQGLANGAYPGGLAGGGGGGSTTKTVGTEIKANGKNSRNDFVIFGGPVSVKFPAPAPAYTTIVSGMPGGQPMGSLLQPGPGIGR